MALLDLLGRRTCLRILWELRAERLSFRALQEAAQTNPSVLNTRLTELRAVGIVNQGAEGYGLTTQGQSLIEALTPVTRWAERWVPKPQA
jgi:DNA-binding HxlR family transcriptional regulator